MTAITYRTNDITRWGTGQGSDLSAPQIDINFYNLAQDIASIQTGLTAGIDFFVAAGPNFYVHLKDHTVLGPYALPVAQWNFRGQWLPSTAYAVMDVITDNGSVYLVIFAHTSNPTFNQFANDGLGHDYYGLLLSQPSDVLPVGGTAGQVLTKSVDSPDFSVEWADQNRTLAFYIEGSPVAGELLLQYIAVETLLFPISLAGSAVVQEIPSSTNVSYDLQKNGASIGQINFFGPSPFSIVTVFPAPITFEPGDILTMVAPSVPDVHQANISFSLLASKIVP